ncbi:hypothetical protein Btru_044927 [Bulinus truncatus]|nr:hypothetical protein Btru_044927 [Bulinus truncatus]
MPSLVSGQDMNGFGYDRGGSRINGITTNGGFDHYRDDFARDDMRRDDDGRDRRGVRNGGPSFDRFNTDYLEKLENQILCFKLEEDKPLW